MTDRARRLLAGTALALMLGVSAISFPHRAEAAALQDITKCYGFGSCATTKVKSMPARNASERITKAVAVVVNAKAIATENIVRAFGCAYTGPGSSFCRPW